MAGIVSDDNGIGRPLEGSLSRERCQSGESLSEWRSCEQVENGTPSTSPPYWDIDDDNDRGAKPGDLYGKFTWKIENFSQISKRELRSNAFEVGGHKWYILIYPQGCDVCNHLSLFLCVANHDKLLPGWSHFAQFTIAVVNKDPKKSKYSDTLHRFWKKEHDWGWKKFMELSKIYDGFVVSDTLVIKAQVQVIREKSHRPFRCLDCQYRRELVRVYLSNVELIFRRFVEEKRGMLGNLIEDKLRWSSFCTFWLGVEQNAKRRMSREKTDTILKDIIKKFFIEKEVTSTLVMDSLYSGLKALEGQSKNKKGMVKLGEMEETPTPIIFIEKDMFNLADDVLILLERAAIEPLPPKDDKGPQNRTKEGSSGDDSNKDSIERDERRLTELGRRTLEIFVIAHIFSSKIEAAYQEAVALKRQEELIREEEAAGHAETELKAKRAKKKQKKKSRKEKVKGRDVKSDLFQEKDRQVISSGNRTQTDFSLKKHQAILDKVNTLEVVSDGGDGSETLQNDVEERDRSPVNWDTDASEIHPCTEVIGCASSLPTSNGERKSSFTIDDSSSTCSTDSVPSVVINGPYKGKASPGNKCQISSSRGKSQRKQTSCDRSSLQSDMTSDAGGLLDSAASGHEDVPNSEAVPSLKELQRLKQHIQKEEEVSSVQKKLSVKDQTDGKKTSKQSTAEAQFSSPSPMGIMSNTSQWKPASLENVAATSGESSSNSSGKTVCPSKTPQNLTFSKPDVPKPNPAKEVIERPTTHQQSSLMSRPSSAPVIPAPRVNAPVVSVVHSSPLLSRSVSAAGRLGTETSPSTQGYIPQSYKNAITGKISAAPPASSAPRSHPLTSGPSPSYAQPTCTVASSPVHSTQINVRKEQNSVQLGSAFGHAAPMVQNQLPWVESSQPEKSSVPCDSYLLNGSHNYNVYGLNGSAQQTKYGVEEPACVPQRSVQGQPDDFPHLDIINYLFDEEHSIGKVGKTNGVFPIASNRHHPLNRQFTYPGDMCTTDMSSSSNCCRFDRSGRYLGDEFGRSYGSSNGSYDNIRDDHPQVNRSNRSTYTNNRQTSGVFYSQWQALRPDLSLLSMRKTEVDGHHPFSMPDYTNLACGVNGYSVFRPANGH